MSANSAKVILAFGAVLIMSALVFLPLGLGPSNDPSALAGGAALFSFGALLLGVGFYVKARALEEQLKREHPQTESAPNPKRKKATCEVCRQYPPVISCSQHRALLCAECMTAHYDARTCVYVPAQRRTARAVAAGIRS